MGGNLSDHPGFRNLPESRGAGLVPSERKIARQAERDFLGLGGKPFL